MERKAEPMGKAQELGKNIASSAREKAQEMASGSHELSHSRERQNLNGQKAEEMAYILIDRHVTYHKTQYSYNEELNKYTEAAFNDYEPHETNELPQQAPRQQLEYNREALLPLDPGSIPRLTDNSIPPPQDAPTKETSNAGAVTKGGLLTGTSEKYNGITFGTAEAGGLAANSYKLSRNEAKAAKLDDKRKYVQRYYTRFTLKTKDKDISTIPKLQYNYYGRIRLNEKKDDLWHLGRVKYEGQIVREKMNRKDYNDRLRKKEKKAFRRRVAGRLLYRKASSLLDNESLKEDESISSLKHGAKHATRAMAMNVRSSIKTLRLQNNVYARLEQANMHRQVLLDKRERLHARDVKAKYKAQMREAQSRKQKQELKKKMVQQRAREEGNFFRRTKHQLMIKKTSREVRHRAVKRVLSTIGSAAMIIIIVTAFLMILLLILLSVTQGASEYNKAAITQNDYDTLTEATAYFRKLETDLDEYLNADRVALEAELEVTYGPGIYEYIYSLAEFGFNASTLMAYLSALYGEFNLDKAREELHAIFEEMYTLTIEIKIEDREIKKYDPGTMEYYTVTEPRKICYVTLEKKEMEDVVANRLPGELKQQYDNYKLSTGGQQVYAPVMQENWENLISSNYGERIHPITKVRTFHKGVDIAVPTGTKLYSAVKGTVIRSQYSDSAGNYVTIQTDTGWTVTFMHMDARAVSTGQELEQGDFVGYSGNTGNSTGPHLHLQVENEKGETINPIFIIPQTCGRIKGSEEIP